MFRKVLILLGLCLAARAAYAASGTVVLGTAPNAPTGPGPGNIFVVNFQAMTAQSGSFAKAGTPEGNSFFAGYDPATQTIFIPSPAGRLVMLSSKDLAPTGSFAVIRGARLARVLPHRNVLIVLSAQAVAAYKLDTHRAVFTLAIGGNALAVDHREARLYVGGNMDRTITAIDLSSGRIVTSYPVAHSGDLVLANDRLFSADIKTGVMSVVDLRTGHISRLKTPEVDPHFSYQAIASANAGFMQLAKSTRGRFVYAAGFSGHILKFSTKTPRYLGEIPVSAGNGANKLSGLAVVDHGTEAVVTIENRDATALVRLATGKILRIFQGVPSNRWIKMQPIPSPRA